MPAAEPPTEAEFFEDSAFGMRPIDPGSGREFALALGGNRQREHFTGKYLENFMNGIQIWFQRGILSRRRAHEQELVNYIVLMPALLSELFPIIKADLSNSKTGFSRQNCSTMPRAGL